jgi:two-component system sensor histidine kinase CpxA
VYSSKVSYNIDPSLYAYADEKLCGMVFDNLYSNAMKYGKSQVHISFQKIDDYLVLSIEDDGDGISNNEKEQIFKMFEQSQKEVRTNNSGGTGIGLYTVQVFVKACKKEIFLEDSKLLGGAKFIIKEKIDDKYTIG